MKLIFKIISIYLLIILLVNSTIYLLIATKFSPVDDIYKKGVIIKAKPYAFLFVHGSYEYICGEDINIENTTEKILNKTCILAHITTYGGNASVTYDFTKELYEEGYKRIWGSWCSSGDHNFSIRYPDGVEYPWQDYVSRNEKPGITVPFFYGFGFFRFSVKD